MASSQVSIGSTVPQLMTSVKQLTPAELREFNRQLTEWQQQNGGQLDENTFLIQACTARLPAADEQRLKKLISKSERATLTGKELEDYRALVGRTEKLDATRLAALTQLARRWDKPVSVVMQTIGWGGGEDDTASDSARPAKTGPRSRR
jgi:hypothetical protein